MARLNEFFTNLDLSSVEKYCREHGTIVRYSKGDCIVREGEVCRVIGIVLDGYFKYFSLNDSGEECVTGFSFRGECVTDFLRSFILNLPSMTTVMAGCRAEVLQVPIAEVRREVLARDPEFINRTSAVLLQEAYRRLIDLHTKTPTQRYEELLEKYNQDIRLVSFREIASYLTISRRHLLRIRRQ